MTSTTLNELMGDIKRRLAIKYWNYSFKPNSWFFPSDLAPHSSKFKRQCKKLYEAGLLERRGDRIDRWGYSYRVRLEG